MIEHRTLRTASGIAADHHSNLIMGPAYRDRDPRVTVVSGSALYNAEPMTIDVTDYAEIKSPSAPVGKTGPFLRSAVGPLLAFAAAALLAITVSLTPAPDRSIFPDGPLAGQSLLHFPR
jgi:hypothetical protein